MSENKNLDFEQGPIRPPNEARSLLLRVTRNCSWNQCLFCPVYKGRTFSRRSVAEVQEDIRTIKKIIEDLKDLSWKTGSGGEIDDAVIARVFQSAAYSQAYRNVAAWMYYREFNVFLQDANNLVLPTAELKAMLDFLRQEVPWVNRITTYARAKTTARKTVEELQSLRLAGLDRVHLGLESGSDRVLALMKKGVTAAEHIEAGRKLKAAGLSVSEYIMPGLGGKELWEDHALETARVLNAIDPDYIRIRSLRVPDRIPLKALVHEGTFTPLTDDEAAEELRLLIDHLEGINSTVTSDHIMNLLEDVSGKLPQDKGKMLAAIDAYRFLPPEEKLIYRFGRRGGAYRSVRDLEDQVLRKKIERAIAEVRTQHPEGLETFLNELVDQYI
ncbi:MAG: radical SAM protein [Desulfobacterota bacterium]|nr:radical SAM protein [Thermodesulfobacteriota bacterium]